MKILIITQSKDIIGGANRSLLDVIIGLKEVYNYQIVVLSPGEGDFTRKINQLGIKYYIFPYKQVSYVEKNDIFDVYRLFKSVKNELFDIILTSSVAKKLIEENFELVYINDTTNIFGYYLAQKLHLPFVWHFRGYNKYIKKYMMNESKLLKAKGLFINISKAMLDYMTVVRMLPIEKSTVIYNGIVNRSKPRLQPWSSNLGYGLHLLHCGHLSEAKGQTDSIKAIAELKRRGYTDIYLHLVGTPAIVRSRSYRLVLEDLARKLFVEDQVIFEGEIKDMTTFRQNMDVELMCSISEPFGRVTVEGMQAGLIVIGCNTGATPEIITDGKTGFIYEQGNGYDLADKIESVYTNHNLVDMVVQNSLDFVKNKFTMEQNVQLIHEALKYTYVKYNE